MNVILTKLLNLEQKRSLFELWNSEYPEKLVYTELSEFEDYLDGLSELKHFLLADDLNKLQGWAFNFERENENWFGIIVNSNVHQKGYGTLLLNELKKCSSVLNGWATDHQNDVKQNKESYLSPMEFYFKNGFSICENIRIENDKISAVKIRWDRK
ncbi:hypothetical protein CLU83_3542 [Flavobacterium sp. 1]|uniref:GNAT family N-acetyltransferase n=1 Tax=Flavobacterium sp. 1 TaxID=2035200 RepID=UPI000C23523F|nr:GNAT family N-acetyltransferase [Flavobacterium sp. 1]PJJ10149.1 hypothetical protein CLU83_3542 [Flavobacterium sp. 1]